jgi:erythromycin esterase-like protein
MECWEADAFIAWARKHLLPLPATDGRDDLAAISGRIGSARVVALGEPAHGAHEPLAFRNRLFRTLVERNGFTAIAIESGLAESRHIADFIAGGPGCAVQLAAEHISWGFGAFRENVELIEWMRDYNFHGTDVEEALRRRAAGRGRSESAGRRELHFYGFDVSAGEAEIRENGGSGESGRIDPESYRAVAARDAEMARNVRWILQREGGAGRVLVFAHNAHVINAALRGGIWSVYTEAPLMLGHHLRAELGSDVCIIGVSAFANSMDTPQAAGPSGSIDTALHRTGVRQFYLDLRKARDDAAACAWLAAEQSMRANFNTEIVLQPGVALDALAFVNELTPAHLAE